MCNNVPFKKSLLFGDIAGIGYQSLKLIKESHNRPKSNWTKTKNGKYLFHGITSIVAQILGIIVIIQELFGFSINKIMFVSYAISSLCMCSTAIPLIIDTPFHKWNKNDKLEVGSDTIGIQLGFF